jgi:hypothetical protein
MSELLIGREPPLARPDPAMKGESPGGAVRWLLAALAACFGVLLLMIGGVYVVADRTQRDADGFLMNPTTTVATDTAALVARSRQGGHGGTGLRFDVSGDAQLKVSGTNELFVGVASARAVDRYLAGVPIMRMSDLGDADGAPRRGTTAPAPATTQRFWVASATGSGEQTLRWDATDGDWRVVVMNADGSRGVKASISAGARHPSFIYLGVGVGLLAAAAVMLAVAVAIMPRPRS